jgi:ABC-type polysaccharide/polyol phosphate transport system ATPase subunit
VSEPAISFTHVSKHFRGGREYRHLRDDLVGGLARVGGNRRPTRHVVRALDDISFEIPEGQSFGLIGENGAGKTTALRLTSRIAYPTSGRVRVRGRVGALIEVGSGMHPELTGRENVHLYGRILGMRRSEILRRFDEIVEFAEIGPALEQPVKQFSSGMQLRLGFALAAHLDPDVLLVDEALAVGDARFQHRCVERMRELVHEGRTLVFVSHDMRALEPLCERVVLLKDGRVANDGPARDVIHAYLAAIEEELAAGGRPTPTAHGDELRITQVTIHDPEGHEVDAARTGEPITVRLHYRATIPVRRPMFGVGISDGRAGLITFASMLVDGKAPETIRGEGYLDCRFDDLPLLPRTYEIWGEVMSEAGYGKLVDWQLFRYLKVAGEVVGAGPAAVSQSFVAPVRVPHEWRFGEQTPRGRDDLR